MNAEGLYGRADGEVSPIWVSYAVLQIGDLMNLSELPLEITSQKSFWGASDAAKWQRKPALEHLAWIKSDVSLGLAIWDPQFKESVWRSKGMWEVIGMIKRGAEE